MKEKTIIYDPDPEPNTTYLDIDLKDLAYKVPEQEEVSKDEQD